MRINIFRNPFIDAQIGYLMDTLIDARRRETEDYWTDIIVNRIKTRLIHEMCESPSDDPCDICGGIELALCIIDDEFGLSDA